MQDGPFFGDVDAPAFEHGRNLCRDAGVCGQGHQQAAGFGRNRILGIVEQDAAGLDRIRQCALRNLGEQVENACVAHFAGVRIQGLPGGSVGQAHEDGGE